MIGQGRVGGSTAVTPFFVVAVLATWLGGVLRLFYVEGSGEHDTFMMAAGIVRAAQTGEVLNAFCYGREIQFLYYYVARALTYLETPTSSEVLLAMNIVGAAASLAIPFLLASVLTHVLGSRARSEVAVLLSVSSPLYLFTVSYGHPFQLALAVLLTSWVVLAHAARLPWSARSRAALLAVVAALLQAAAFMLRLEQVALAAIALLAFTAVDWRRQRRLLALGATALAVGGALFLAGRALLPYAPSVGTPPQHGLTGYLNIVWQLFNPRLVAWGSAHLVTEVGMPLLAIAAAVAAASVVHRCWRFIFALLAGVTPSLGVYLANPSPPRHFYIVSLALACFIAGAASDRWLMPLRLAFPALLLAGLVLPWTVMAIGARSAAERATVSYNVIERTDRNKRQIREAFVFYDRLVAEARGRPLVVFGSWVHLAQLASSLVHDPNVRIERVDVVPRVTAIALRGPGIELYFIETYARRTVVRATASLRETGDAYLCISLLKGGPSVNDLGLPIPPEIRWWTS